MKKIRAVSYFNPDIWKWVVEEARKLRISESSFIHMSVGEKKDNVNG